jgi:cytochrome c556
MKLKKVVTSLFMLALGVTRVAAESAHASKRLGAAKKEIMTFEEEHTFTYNHNVWEQTAGFTAKQRIDRENKLQQGDNNVRPVYGILTEPLRGEIKAEEHENANASYVPRAHV